MWFIYNMAVTSQDHDSSVYTQCINQQNFYDHVFCVLLAAALCCGLDCARSLQNSAARTKIHKPALAA